MRRKLLVTLIAALGALAIAGAALAESGGAFPPTPRSPNASRINDSYLVILVFTGIIFLLVEGALAVFIVRFRRRGRARTVEGPQIHGSTKLELIWTVVPVVVLALIGGFVFYKLPGIQDIPDANADGGRIEVQVRGQQFYWQFTYPNGAVSINTLHAPAGRVVKLDVTSPGFDVNHSWWVPALGGKFDAIPGTTNHTWFEASRVGTYTGQCAEFCGIQHAEMKATVAVQPAADYARWVSQRAQGGIALGREEYQGVCASCHRLAQAFIGPALGGNPILKDRASLEKVVREGGAQMPPVGKLWTTGQMDALLAYTKTIKAGAGGG